MEVISHVTFWAVGHPHWKAGMQKGVNLRVPVRGGPKERTACAGAGRVLSVDVAQLPSVSKPLEKPRGPHAAGAGARHCL